MTMLEQQVVKEDCIRQKEKTLFSRRGSPVAGLASWIWCVVPNSDNDNDNNDTLR